MRAIRQKQIPLMIKFSIINTAIIAIFTFIVSAIPAISQTPPPIHRVLVLMSYNDGHLMEDDILKGVKNSFANSSLKYELFIEYMDAKRHNIQLSEQLLFDLYKFRYQNKKFDVLIAADNIALDFVVKYRDSLFSSTPVVFCGVNDFNESMLKGQSGITGVVENIDIKGTIELLMSTIPNVNRIYAINDITETGMRMQSELDSIKKNFTAISFINLINLTKDELQEQLKILPPNSAVLLFSFHLDKNRQYLEINQFLNLILTNCKQPVYTMWQHFMNSGVIGGKVLSGWTQGEAASDMAIKIINGKSADSIPILEKSPNRNTIDFKAFTEHGLIAKNIPAGTIIINTNESFYTKYKTYVHLTLIFFTILLGIIAILISFIIRLKRTEKTLGSTCNSLSKLHQLLDNIIKSMPSTIIVVDDKFIITMLNQIPDELADHDSSLSVSKDLFTTVPFLSKFRKELHDVLATETMRQIYKEQIEHKKKFYNIFLIPITLENSKGIVIRLDDVTESEKKEEKLRQSQKMDTIGNLAGGLAHDFNNLLGAITGTTSLARYQIEKDDFNNKEMSEHIEIIEEATSRAKDIVNNLLMVSRKKELVLKPVNLNTVIKNVITLCKNSFDKSVEIKVDLFDQDPVAKADQTQIEQSLLNLCVNALHAMTIMRPEQQVQGGILSVSIEKIHAGDKELKVHPGITEGDYWKIKVTDTGIGMSNETLARIFDPFFTTKENKSGTGLGLSMVYDIITQHKGFIEVQSNISKGSTFSLHLPEHIAKKESIPADSIPQKKSQTCKGTILLIDDENVIRITVKKILSDYGFDILVAEDGELGIDMYQKNQERIDLVILDMSMAKLSGKDTFLQLKKLNPKIKVIISSGFRMDKRIEETMQNGAVDFIGKPFTFSELTGVVKRHIL